MLRLFVMAMGTAVFWLCTSANIALHALAPQSQDIPRLSVLAGIQEIIARTAGADFSSIEIEISGNILTVVRVNSPLYQATHAGRDNEATAIASLVANEIAGKPGFENLVTLRVRYVMRSAGKDETVDAVEFRKDPTGKFEFHRT